MLPALKLLQQLMTKGMKATASLWPSLQIAYKQVHQVVQILANQEQYTGAQVRERYLAFASQMLERKADVGSLAEAIEHFCHITNNFAAGLFQCYDVEGLPRTNNDLEHCFGVARVHERRATGRRGPFLVWWSVGPSASSRLSLPESKASPPRTSDPAIIRGGTNCVYTCSSVKKLADGNSVSAKILLPIWLLWKLNYSCEVFRSAKKGCAVSQSCQKRLIRRTTMVSWHEEKKDVLAQIRSMRAWVLEVELIFDGSWAAQAEEISNAAVWRRLDAWLSRLATFLQADGRTEDEQLRLGHLLTRPASFGARYRPLLRCGRFSSHKQ